MTRFMNSTGWFFVIGFLAGLTLAGCSVTPRSVASPGGPPSCQEAIDSSLAMVSDDRLAQLLDEALADDNLDACWQPAVEVALEQQRNIPHGHLAKAVEVFNQRRHAELFHAVVSRYLSSLANGQYRKEERRLLEAYARYAIDHAASSSDPRLRDVKLLCAKLDSDLYSKLFD